MIEVNSVGDRTFSIRAVLVVSSHSNWGQLESCWSWSDFYSKHMATFSKPSPSSPAPSRRGQGCSWCLSVTKCLIVLQWGTQCQVLSRQDNCYCNSLLLDTEFREQNGSKDCSNKEASDKLRSLDPRCMLTGPWMFLSLLLFLCKGRMSEVTSLVFFTSGMWEVNLFA